MKEYYKINEVSKLYGIGVDSLRYYEKIGVVKPRRDRNGYRLYSLKDFYRLNIVRDLRQLDFSMRQIKEYLDRQSIDNTLALLREEEALIREQLRELHTREQIIRDRVATLTAAARTRTGVCAVRALPDRPCVQLNEYITRDEEMDFAFKKLHRKHEGKIRDFGNQPIGASVSVDDLNRGLFNVFRRVFFILERGASEWDFVLPAGNYLSCFYRGAYRQSPERIGEVLSCARETGHRILDDPFEIYEVDNRDTIRTEEFLTEIQVMVSEGAEDARASRDIR